MSVDTLAKMEISVPVVGALREVTVVLVCAPAELRVLTKVAQLVAVTTEPTDTVEIVDCPHPKLVDPVDQNRFIPAVVLPTNPL